MPLARSLLMYLLVFGLVSCKSDKLTGSSASSQVTGIRAYISTVSTSSGTTGVLRSGSLPAGRSGSAPTVPSTLSVINGGTSALAVSATVTYYKVAIAVDGVADYWEISIPGGSRSVYVLITLAQSIQSAYIPIAVTTADGSGTYGLSKSVSARVTQVGSGDVQISLSWEGRSDVDLHVVDPSSEEIYYGHKSSASGGKLDLDSNAGCFFDDINNENVTWPLGRSPSGTYKVLVDYFSSCGVSSTPFVVTVTVTGSTPHIYQGTLSGAGDRGGRGAGYVITTVSK